MPGIKLVIPTQFTNSALPVLPPVPATITSDSFNRADTSPGVLGATDGALGGRAGLVWSGATQMHIVGNRVGATTLTTPRFSTVDLGNGSNHYVEAKIWAAGGGVLARVQSATATPDGYSLVWSASQSRLELTKIVGGSSTTLWASPTLTFVYGNSIGLGVKGNNLYVYNNGELLNTLVDTTYPAGSRAGVRSPFNDVSFRLDDFRVLEFNQPF